MLKVESLPLSSSSNVHLFDDLSFLIDYRLDAFRWTNGLIKGAADFPAERKRPSADRWTRQIFCNQLVTGGRARRFHQGRGFLPRFSPPPPDNVQPDPKHGTLQILPVFNQPRWFLHETFLFSSRSRKLSQDLYLEVGEFEGRSYWRIEILNVITD